MRSFTQLVVCRSHHCHYQEELTPGRWAELWRWAGLSLDPGSDMTG